MICVQCDKETSNPKFCSRSCAARYNGHKFPKRRLAANKFCPKCGGRKIAKAIHCQKCMVRATIYSEEEQKEKDRKRYHINRLEWVERKGGKCVVCYSVDKLEFDHIDPIDKKYPVSSILRSKDKIDEEMAKCQLLCKPCHVEKSREDRKNVGIAQLVEC